MHGVGELPANYSSQHTTQDVTGDAPVNQSWQECPPSNICPKSQDFPAAIMTSASSGGRGPNH